MKLFAVTIVALRTADKDLKYNTSILECETEEVAIGAMIKRINKDNPDHLICPPYVTEIPRDLMESFLQRNK